MAELKAGGGLMLGGTALSIFGNILANRAQARAEEANAAFLDEQAEFAQEATQRELDIFERETEQLLGEQVGAFAKGGVELSGSALDMLNETQFLASRELEAIRAAGDIQVKEARLKASSARFTASQLKSFGVNVLQSSGTLLTGVGSAIK